MDTPLLADDPQDLLRLARDFVERFWRDAPAGSRLEVVVRVEQTAPVAGDGDGDQPPLVSAKTGEQRLALDLHVSSLGGLSVDVLQAALDLELAGALVGARPEVNTFNFSRTVLPLFPVTGTALQLVRHLTAHLEEGLKGMMAVQMLVAMGHAPAQLVHWYHRLGPSDEQAQRYRSMQPHAWIKALWLCRQWRLFAPIGVLTKSGLPALARFWWDCHGYVSAEDRRFMDTLFHLAKPEETGFSQTLVGLFKQVRDSYLNSSPSPAPSTAA